MAITGKLYALAKQERDLHIEEQFRSILRESEETGAVIIDGRNIAAGSIFANQLHAESVTADKIKGGEITGDHIEANSIGADRLISNEILLPGATYGGVYINNDGLNMSSTGLNVTLSSSSGFNITDKAGNQLIDIDPLTGNVIMQINEMIIGGHNAATQEDVEERVKNIELTPGPAGPEGKGVSTVVREFQNSSSGTTIPTDTQKWSETPNPVKGQYMWERVTTSYTKGTPDVSHSVTYSAKDGSPGSPGKPGTPGEAGVGVSGDKIEYARSTSGTVIPTSGWGSSIPSVPEGQFLWTRTTITYTNNKKTETYTSAKQGEKGEPGADAISGVLTNESITFAANSSGNIATQNYVGNTGNFLLMEGAINRSSLTSVTYSIVSQTNVKATISSNGAYTISSMTGGTNVTAGEVTFRATYKGTTIDKTISISKSIAGQAGSPGLKGDPGAPGSTGAPGSPGSPATSYWLTTSSDTVTMKYDGDYDPKVITFYGHSKTGTSNATTYAGRFIIQTSTNGTSYTQAYRSSSNQSSYAFTIPSNVSFIKAKFYQAGGTTYLLDEQTVPVLQSAENLEIGGRNLLIGTSEEEMEVKTSSFSIGAWNPGLTIGEEYTFSFDIKSENATYLQNVFLNSSNSGFVPNHPITKEWTRVQFTFKWKGGTYSGRELSPHVYPRPDYSGTYISRIKLEKGNIATDWTPAPEDVEEAYTAVAEAKANLAETQAKAHADGKVTAEEKRAIADAEKKLAEAKTHANKSIDDLEVGGVNLLVQSTITRGRYFRSDGVTTADAQWFYTDFIPVKGVKHLTTSGYSNLGNAPSVTYHNSSKAFVKGINNANQSRAKLITIDSGIEFVRFSGMIKDLPTLKIEQGKKSTTWSPSPQDVEEAYTAVAEAKANLAETEAKAYADGVVDYEEKRAIQDAKDKLEEAKRHAEKQVDDIEIGGRNLFISTNTRNGYETNGNITNSTEAHQTMEDLVPINGNSKIIYQVWNPNKTVNSSNTNRIGFLNSNGDHISSVILSRLTGSEYQVQTLTPPAGSKFIRIGVIMGAPNANIDPDIKVKVEEGSKPTGYTPAPEDVTLDINKKTYNQVRYIRDWSGGSNRNAGNHKYELQAYANGENIARGKTVTGNGSSNSNLQILTNGSTSTGAYLSLGDSRTPVYAQVDLGKVYYNVDSIAVWRYYNDNRIYHDTKTEVSADGTNWVPIFDSFVEGEYQESAAGRTYPNTQAKSESLISGKESMTRLGDDTSKVTISGGNIKAGTISSDNNYSWIDLDKGHFSFGNKRLVWNGSEMTVNGKIEVKNIDGDIPKSKLASAVQTEISAGATAKSTLDTKARGWDAKETTTGAQAKANTAEANAKELASAMAFGKMLYTDPTFKYGQNSINHYNNSGGTGVTIARIATQQNAPTDSTHILRVTTSTAATSPGLGGFSFQTMTSANKTYITRFIAKIPSGRSLIFASNATGSGGNHTRKWLSSNQGTGRWEEYVYKVTAGDTGSFSSTNFFYISGGSKPLTWYIAYATVFDVTDDNLIARKTDAWSYNGTTEIDGKSIRTGTLEANKITTGTLKSQNNNSWINLNNGEFNFAKGGLVYSGGNLTLNGKLNVSNLDGAIPKSRLDSTTQSQITAGNTAKTTVDQNKSKWDNVVNKQNADSRLNNIVSEHNLPYTKDIIVYGDSNKYYPVYVRGGNQDLFRTIKIWRRYGERGPNDWHTGSNSTTHKGSLMLTWKGNFGGWGGATYREFIEENTSAYTTLLADCFRSVHSMAYTFMLRGGGSGGAIYHMASDQSLGQVEIYYNGSSDIVYPNSNANHIVRAANPVSEVNSGRLEELKLAKSKEVNEVDDKASNAKNKTDAWTYRGETTIDGGAIQADTITAAQIAANSITADELNVDKISSLTSELGDVTAGTITSENGNLHIDLNKGLMEIADGMFKIQGKDVADTEDLGKLEGKINDEVELREGFISSNNGVITIGQKGSPTNIQIKNDRISFMQNGAEVAYISEQTMEITHGIFVKSAKIGEHKQQTLSGGHTVFTWEG